MKVKYCREVAVELGYEVPEGPFLPTLCCDSCHEDANLGYEQLPWYGESTQVCCAILRLLPEEVNE